MGGGWVDLELVPRGGGPEGERWEKAEGVSCWVPYGVAEEDRG